MSFYYPMPTILRKEGFSFRIYLDDHIPAHVHVFKAEGEVKIQIGDDFADCRLISVYGMNRKDAKRALEIAIAHRMKLLNCWRKIHG